MSDETDHAPARGITYGRGRLLLGVSGVGTWVVLALLALIFDAPSFIAEQTGMSLAPNAGAIAGIALLALLVQSPFDLLGGYLLPKSHARTDASLASFVRSWLRGAIAYTLVAVIIGAGMLLASRAVGVFGIIAVGVLASLLLLIARTPFAMLLGGMRTASHTEANNEDDTRVLDSPDVGFTGGIEGVFQARAQLLPKRWHDDLDDDTLALLLRRRREAVSSGLWHRGRLGALVFIWAGIALAASQVGSLAGTAGGLLEFAAFFTLWSFLGLLILPTLSRRASRAIDANLINAGTSPEDIAALASSLDRMQDDEPDRPGWIEAVFHPIPNASSRESLPGPAPFAAWDIARTAAFLGIAGLSPLGRAVHCNCGRPSLWAYLPLD